MNPLAPVIVQEPALPALVMAAGGHAQVCFLEFFAAAIRNPHTRRAYSRAVAEFLAWCERHGAPSLTAVQPLHVATWIEVQARTSAASTVKQQLAAIRHLSACCSEVQRTKEALALPPFRRRGRNSGVQGRACG